MIIIGRINYRIGDGRTPDFLPSNKHPLFSRPSNQLGLGI